MDNTLLRYKADNSRLKDHIRSLVEETEGNHTFLDDFKENLHDIRSRNYSLPKKDNYVETEPAKNGIYNDNGFKDTTGAIKKGFNDHRATTGAGERNFTLKTSIPAPKKDQNDAKTAIQNSQNTDLTPKNASSSRVKPGSLLLDKLSRQNDKIEYLEATVRKLELQNLQLSDDVYTSNEKLSAANRKLERSKIDGAGPKIEPPQQKTGKTESGSEQDLRRQLAVLQQQNSQLELRNSKLAFQNSQLAREAADNDQKLERVRHSVIVLQQSYKKAYTLTEDLRFMQGYIRRFWQSRTAAAAAVGQTDSTESLLHHDSTTEVLIRGGQPHAGVSSVERAYIEAPGPAPNRLRSAVYAVLFVHRVQKRLGQGGL